MSVKRKNWTIGKRIGAGFGLILLMLVSVGLISFTGIGNIVKNADEVIDAKGRLVIPGGIAPHTHMDMPFGGTNSADDFETGTVAAAHGGTTTLIDFAIQTKGESTLKGLDTWHAKAEYLSDIVMSRTGPVLRSASRPAAEVVPWEATSTEKAPVTI